jgi:hypothetical protein
LILTCKTAASMPNMATPTLGCRARAISIASINRRGDRRSTGAAGTSVPASTPMARR